MLWITPTQNLKQRVYNDVQSLSPYRFSGGTECLLGLLKFVGGLNYQTQYRTLAENVILYQFLGLFQSCLLALWNVVKFQPIDPKIGTLTHSGQMFSFEF